jgi:hypothetical protein
MRPTTTKSGLKIRKLSEVSSDKRHLEKSLSTNQALPENFEQENHQLLRHYQQLWENLREWRERFMRSDRYHYGDQWGDLIYNPDTNKYMKEEDYIKEQGKVPLKQNIIRQLIKNLQGQYRTNPTQTMVFARNRQDAVVSDMMANAIQTVHDINHTKQLDAQLLLNFALSGAAIGKMLYSFIPERDTSDIMLNNVNPMRVFFNTDMEDIRGNDLRDVGEIHDLPINDVLSIFARTPEDEAKIRRWYSVEYFREMISNGRGLSGDRIDRLDFWITDTPGMCRVIEGWSKRGEWRTWVHDYYDGTYRVRKWSLEEVEQMNAERIAMFVEAGIPVEEVPLMEAERRFDQFWYCKFITPYGHTLWEGESPYEHKGHPYEIVLYPFVNGRVWGLVEDIIDQNRYINRIITLMDFLVSSSAKGLLLVPEDAIPKGMDISDFAEEWSRVGGVVKYRARPGVAAPQQVTNNAIPVGLQDMLAMQLKLTYDIMGVHAAIQGQQAKAGTPASLYAQEAQNATMNVKDFMENFNFFKLKRDIKVMKLVKQYYLEKRNLFAFGTNSPVEARIYDPEAANDVEYDLVVTQGPDTPVYRQIIEDVLSNLLINQMIDLEMYLEHSSMPFADKLLESVRIRRAEMAAQQQGGGGQQGVPPDFINEIAGATEKAITQADPRVEGILNKMLQQPG